MFTAHSVPARHSRRSTPLYLERLEDRLAPAITPKPADMVVLANGPASSLPGIPILVTVTLINDGPYAAYGVVLTESLSAPPGSDFTITPAASNPDAFTESIIGGLGVETANAPILSSTNPDVFVCVITAFSGGAVTCTATVTADTPDPNPNNNSASVTTTIPTADISVAMTGPTSILGSGAVAAFETVTLTNKGPDPASGVVLSDTLPSGWASFSITPVASNPDRFTANFPIITETANGTIAAGDVDEFVVTFTPPAGVANGTVVTNSASVSTTSYDPDSANNSSAVKTVIVQPTDVAVTETGPSKITAGAPVTYTLSLTNKGSVAGINVVLTDVLPSGETLLSQSQTNGTDVFASTNSGNTASFTAPTMVAGDTDVFEVVARVASSFANGAALVDTASDTADNPNPSPGDATASVTSSAVTVADVSVAASGPATISAGGNASYTISLTNNGPSNATNVLLSDDLPTGLTLTSEKQLSGPDTFTNASTGNTVEFTAFTVAAGDTDVFLITATAAGNLTAGATLADTATVTATTSDPNSANNTASVNTKVTAPTGTWLATDIAGGSNDSTQLLWTTPGESAIWSITSSGSGTSGPVYGSFAGWSAVADATGSDGNTRILWTNTNGAAALWIVNAAGAIQQTAVFGPFSGWTATGLAVGSDNNARILWTNTNGAAVVWDVTGPNLTVVPGTIFDPGGGWVARRLAAGSDGLLRLLWTNPSGASAIYTLSATGALETAGVYGAIAGWTPVAIAVGSDDQLRILWDSSSGEVAIWDVNASYGVTAATVYGPFAGWVGEALVAEADGTLRLLWDNASGAASLWDLTASAAFISASVFGPVPVGGS